MNYLILILFFSWLYRIRPSVCHRPFEKIPNGKVTNEFSKCPSYPNQVRWMPFQIPEEPIDFVQGITLCTSGPIPRQSANHFEGLTTICGAGDVSTKTGCAVHLYFANTSMTDKAFYNSDGDFLIGIILIKIERINSFDHSSTSIR